MKMKRQASGSKRVHNRAQQFRIKLGTDCDYRAIFKRTSMALENGGMGTSFRNPEFSVCKLALVLRSQYWYVE